MMDILARKILGTKAGGYEGRTKMDGLGRMLYGPYSMGSKDFDPMDGFGHPSDMNMRTKIDESHTSELLRSMNPMAFYQYGKSKLEIYTQGQISHGFSRINCKMSLKIFKEDFSVFHHRVMKMGQLEYFE